MSYTCFEAEVMVSIVKLTDMNSCMAPIPEAGGKSAKEIRVSQNAAWVWTSGNTRVFCGRVLLERGTKGLLATLEVLAIAKSLEHDCKAHHFASFQIYNFDRTISLVLVKYHK